MKDPDYGDLDVLDVVRTKHGTLAVIDEVAKVGSKIYSLVLPPCSRQKVAWYNRNELTYVGALKDLVK